MDIPDDLIHAFEPAGGHGVVAFVGSGPSCDAGLPGWSELIRRVADDLSLGVEVAPYLASGRFLEAVQFLSRQRSEEEVQQRIANEVRRVDEPGVLHDLIVRAPFSGIVTTNYDLLLTTADQNSRFDPPVTPRGVSVRNHFRRPFVFHMHGHINDPKSIVLTRHGYDQIVAPEGAAARQFLFNILGGYSVLFIGFGFRDLNLDSILREGEQLEALGYSSVFGLVPSTASIDPVFDQNLRTRRINPVYLTDGGDHGKHALCTWLAELSRSVEKIARARRLSARAIKPAYLLASLESVFLTNEWGPLVSKAMAQLADRPDLENWARKGFGDHDVKRLFEEVSVDELRQILVIVNRERRSFVIEDGLSCFPPATIPLPVREQAPRPTDASALEATHQIPSDIVATTRSTPLRTSRDKVFISYSHKDRKLFEELKTMLGPAIREGVLELWDDQQIDPGRNWKDEIQRALSSAGVAVLLVSQHFLASDFIARHELPPLLEAAQKEGTTVFWIYLSSCLYQQTAITAYQAAHDVSKPLDRLDKPKRQAVLSEICAKLIRLART